MKWNGWSLLLACSALVVRSFILYCSSKTQTKIGLVNRPWIWTHFFACYYNYYSCLVAVVELKKGTYLSIYADLSRLFVLLLQLALKPLLLCSLLFTWTVLDCSKGNETTGARLEWGTTASAHLAALKKSRLYNLLLLRQRIYIKFKVFNFDF